MSVEPWSFAMSEGPARMQGELDAQGWSVFHAPELLALSADPVALTRALFGAEPLRFRRQELKADPANPLRAGYWRSTREARVHTDGPACGLPPSALVMVCKQPARDGGDVLLLDTWPLLRAIEADDPALFAQLFDAPRRLQFADADHWGPTVSLRRGNLVTHHPPFADESCAISRAFHARVEDAPKVRFRLREGDVYVVNNHRCLHGRLAFEDLGRTIVRTMVWLLQPFAAPADLRDRAARAGEALAARLEGQPSWLRRRFGAERAAPSPAALDRLARAVDFLRHPRDTAALSTAEARALSELEDALLSAAAAVFDEPLPAPEEQLTESAALLDRLRREAGDAVARDD
jgi:hypothetical protein